MTCLYLRPESLTQDPIERLREAAGNLWWAVADIGELVTESEALEHHFDVTPIHEAGHAIAATLAGRNIKCVTIWHPFARWRKTEACGFVECDDWASDSGPVALAKIAARLGPQALVLDMVQTYAGPAAEVRHNPRCAASGKEGDFDQAEKCAKWLDMTHGIDSHALQDWAWSEACRMMADPNVWGAVTAVADRLKASQVLPPKTSGGFVRSTVRKHLPNGWAWSRDWQSFKADDPAQDETGST